MNECPDYTNTGNCKNKKCRLNHVDRAGALRKAAAERATSTSPQDGHDSDVSSDQDFDEIDSDDIDSVDLSDGDDRGREEGVSKFDAHGDVELSAQQDFVPLR